MAYESPNNESDHMRQDMGTSSKLKLLPSLRMTNSSGYQGVAHEESPSDESDSDLEEQADSKWLKVYAVVLTILAVSLGAHSVFSWTESDVGCKLKDGDGYRTEWKPARSTIEKEEVIFTSAFRYNATADTYYREFSLDQPQYVGSPGPEIDKAWDGLLAGQYLVLSEEEAKLLDDPVPIRGIYLAEVEVMHSLHCVNALRKALYHEYYSQHDMHALPKDLQQIHIEHCLDQLRQTVQCAGDLTPVPLRPYGEEPNMNLIGTPQAHTCRNWDIFRKWYTERGVTYGTLNGGGT